MTGLKFEAPASLVRPLLVALALLGFIHSGSAQLQVDIKL